MFGVISILSKHFRLNTRQLVKNPFFSSYSSNSTSQLAQIFVKHLKTMSRLHRPGRGSKRNYSSNNSDNMYVFDSGHFRPNHQQPPIEDVPRWMGSSNSLNAPQRQLRRVTCGELREKDEDEVIEIFGRVQNQQLGRFVIIKDAHGATQLVAHNENIVRRLQNIPVNSNITVVGRVKRRPLRQVNEKIATGGIEVSILDILSVRRTMTMNAHRPAKVAGMQIRCASSQAGQNVIKITSTEMQKCSSEGVKDAFMHRTHTCGELGAEHVGLKVSLCGWISHNHFCKFIHIKDGYGVVQAVVPSHKEDIISVVKTADIDTTVEVSGVVKYRPSGHESPAMETGLIEVVIDSFSLAENRKPSEKEQENLMTSNSNFNLFTNRTHNCGQLREEHINQNVTLCGWLAFERMNKFLLLRDAYGITQCVVLEDSSECDQQIKDIPHESILQIEGIVTARPPNSIKTDIPTGQVEVCVKKLTLLNKARPNLPFNIRDYNKANESLRLKHRYMDLRFDEMQYNLRMRSKITMKIREFLINHCDFVDVETPTLFRKTPGGAQEFIVPTQHPGKCYSLVQSPQQMKQMLMIGGIDKYFQIARCYRDEGSRSDRQPEFTQLDIEMSFTTRDGVMELIERLLKYVCSDFPVEFPIPKITYLEALTKYGTDKPDLRYDYKFEDCTEEFQSHPDKENSTSFAAHCFVLKEIDPKISKSFQKYLNDLKNKFSEVKCIYSVIPSNADAWVTKISPLLTEEVANALKSRFQLQENDLLILGYGQSSNLSKILQYLGNARSEYIKKLEEQSEHKFSTNKFLWVVDFPLFESSGENGTLVSTHHPFTQPHPDDLEKLDTEPLKVRSLAYDLVLNGVEVGGGSIRIHDAAFQRKILQLLQINSEEMHYFLEALEMGAPPHGGIALGLDRFLATLLNLKTIREVIAFPKTVDGKDVLSEAPSDISKEDLRLYNLELLTSDVQQTQLKNENI